MLNLLVRLFVKDSEKIGDPVVRGRYGILTGAAGIFLNICLFSAKFLAGFLTQSIAITADAFNNLSDAGSSVVTMIGFKMAGMPADREHPFGHGRIEYLSGLMISMAIMLVGLELARSSFSKILHPEAVDFSIVSVCILIASVFVKLWMCWFNRSIGKKINSAAMRATAMDSLTDAIATTAVIIGILIGYFSGLRMDGYIGMVVALFILYTGFTTARDSLSPLLGQAPDQAFVEAIGETVMAHDEVIGIHDLIIHDYGPGRCIISLHAEVPSNMDILVMHDAIDVIELELRHKFNCDVTIHMDPIALNDPETDALRSMVKQIVDDVDAALSIHDFRVVKGSTHTNLIFDVLVPHRFELSDAQIAERVRNGVHQANANYFAVVKVEKAFI